MKTLDEAWEWCECTRRQLRIIARLGMHWDDLPWSGGLGGDATLSSVEAPIIERETTFSLEHLNDLAVVVLFSVFEAQVRKHIQDEMRPEADTLRHRALRLAATETLRQVAEGSFFRVLEPFKDAHADLIEEVNQVRRYRNWVAHGKTGDPPERVTPRRAFDRLQRFLAILRPGETEVDS